MNKKIFPIIKDTLLVTLLIYTLIVSWNYGGMLAFVSIVVLGIVLGLLTLVYDIPSLQTSRQIGIHIGGSVLAILIVALINGWLVIDWGRVFTIILVIAILAIVGYGGYMYYKNRKENPQQNARPSDFDHTLEEEYEKEADRVAYVEDDQKIHPDHEEVIDPADYSDKETPAAFRDYPAEEDVEPEHYQPEEETVDADFYEDNQNVEYVPTDSDEVGRLDEALIEEPQVVEERSENIQDVEYVPTDTDDHGRPDEALVEDNIDDLNNQNKDSQKSTYTYPEDI